MKKSIFRTFKEDRRKSSHWWFKEMRDFSYMSLLQKVNGRRISRWNGLYKTRVFDRNMVQGLCYGKFYGRDKIVYKRKDFVAKRKRKRYYND